MSEREAQEEIEYEVEAVVDRKVKGRIYQVFVKWLNCSWYEATWEPEEEIRGHFIEELEKD